MRLTPCPSPIYTGVESYTSMTEVSIAKTLWTELLPERTRKQNWPKKCPYTMKLFAKTTSNSFLIY